MAYVFNPITGKLDDAGNPTTDASLLTSGTLSDSRLSANVSLDDQNNNFSASQTFAGSANTAPNQTAASGSSIMTRSLADDRAWQFITPAQLIIPASGFSFGTANSGTASFVSGGAATATCSATVAGSVAWMNAMYHQGSGAFNTNNGGSGGLSLAYNRKWAMSFSITRSYITTANSSTDIRLTNVGGTTTPLYTVAATDRGVGMKITNYSASNTASFQCYSGTGSAVTYATAVTGQAIDDIIHLRIYCDGVGSVVFAMYKYGVGWVTLGTVARPIAGSAAQMLQFSAINAGVTAERNDMRVIGSVVFTDLDALA